MVEELSHLAFFLIRFLGDPLMVSALLVGILICFGIAASIALWRISQKILHVLKGQKEIKDLITEALISARELPHTEESRASLPTSQDASHVLNLPNTSSSEALQKEEELSPRTIVQTYRAGKSLYLLYSDGSVEADTDGHIQTFSSIHLLKEAMARKNQNTHLRSAS